MNGDKLIGCVHQPEEEPTPTAEQLRWRFEQIVQVGILEELTKLRCLIGHEPYAPCVPAVEDLRAVANQLHDKR